MLFQKKKKSYLSQVEEHYTPATLPKHGNPDLSSYITAQYKLQSEDFLKKIYNDCTQKFSALLASTDSFTLGSVFDSFVDGQMEHLRNIHRQEVAMHQLQGEHIRAARQVRMGELDHSLSLSDARRQSLGQEIRPLQGKHARLNVEFGPVRIPIGILVTIAAMIIDAFLNFSFLENLLTQNENLLRLTVLAWSIFSDVTMCVAGMFLSQKGEDCRGQPKALFWAEIFILFGLFLISSVCSVLLRLGSMDITFGAINAQGQFVSSGGFSLAQYVVTIITGFLTTCTGLLSFFLSLDPDAVIEKRRRKLEQELLSAETQYRMLQAERTALELAEDPMIRDQACREAADANLEALPTGLKLHLRKLLAEKQGSADYTDAMSTSATQLVHPVSVGEADAGADDATLTEYKKAV